MKLFGPSSEQQMLIELSRKFGFRTVHGSQVFVVHVIDDAIRAVFETAKFDRPAPMAGKERIVNVLIFTDHMRFGKIEPDIVKISDILASR